MISEIEKTNLRDGDMLVFRCTEILSDEAHEQLQETVSNFCRNISASMSIRLFGLVLGDDLNLEAWSTERLEHLGRAISDATASRTKKGKP